MINYINISLLTSLNALGIQHLTVGAKEKSFHHREHSIEILEREVGPLTQGNAGQGDANKNKTSVLHPE